MRELEPPEGVQIQIHYVTTIFRTGFGVPEGIRGVSLKRKPYAPDGSLDSYLFEFTVEASTPEAARETVREFRSALIRALGEVD